MDGLYKHAIDKFIDLSTQDVTSQISKEHSINGLMKILSCYHDNKIHYDDVNLIALPDFTFTRNKLRWDSGFAYGCIYLMQPEVEPIIPLDCRPNCCGVILAKIPEWNDKKGNFCNKMLEIIHSFNEINIEDFKRRNHFVAVLKDSNDNYYALFHGSFAKVKSGTNGLPGLYSEKTDHWDSKIQKSINFPDFSYLIGEDALEYFQVYKKHESFTIRYRETIFHELFDGKMEAVFNSTHEGLHDINTILMGGYASHELFECPIMQSPESTLPIVLNDKSIKELTKNKIDRKLYCSPHGGGYMWPYAEKAAIEKQTGMNYTKITMKDNQAVMYCDNIGDMPFHYRKDVANFWSLEKGACKISNTLTPVFFAKF